MKICIVMNVALRKIHKIKERREILSENTYRFVTITQAVRVPGSLCRWPVRWQGKILTLSAQKTTEKALPHPPVPD